MASKQVPSRNMDFKRALEVREHGVQRGFQQGEEDRAAGQGGLCPSLAGIMAGCEDGGGFEPKPSLQMCFSFPPMAQPLSKHFLLVLKHKYLEGRFTLMFLWR